MPNLAVMFWTALLRSSSTRCPTSFPSPTTTGVTDVSPESVGEGPCEEISARRGRFWLIGVIGKGGVGGSGARRELALVVSEEDLVVRHGTGKGNS